MFAKNATISVDNVTLPAEVNFFSNVETMTFNTPSFSSRPPKPRPKMMTTRESSIPTIPPRFNKPFKNSTSVLIEKPLYAVAIAWAISIPWKTTAQIAPSKAPITITGIDGFSSPIRL